MVALKSAPEVRMAMVPLTEAEHELSLAEAAAIDAPENEYGVEMRDRVLKSNHLYHALRAPEDVTQKVFNSWRECAELFELADLEYLGEEYAAMVHDSSPAFDGMDEEQLSELKKALETIDWSVLSGAPWYHLKAFFLTASPDALRASLYGRSSISKLIGMNENSESTLNAEES
jgi:hypothetical protein